MANQVTVDKPSAVRSILARVAAVFGATVRGINAAATFAHAPIMKMASVSSTFAAPPATAALNVPADAGTKPIS